MPAILTPLTIVALAPFCPAPESGGTGVPPVLMEADPADPDAVVRELGPRLRVPVPKDLCPAGEVTVTIRSMRDFTPRGLPGSVDYLDRLAQAGAYARQAASAGADVASTVREMASRWPNLPLEYPEPAAVHEKSPKPADDSQVDDILAMVAVDEPARERAATAKTLSDVARQAAGISRAVMAHIVADPDFRRFESVWQGVRLLLRQGMNTAEGRVRLLLAPATHENLKESLDALLPQLAQDLPGLLLCDLEFDNTPRHIEQLGHVAEFAESLLCPAAVWAGPGLFGVESWEAFGRLAYLRHHLDDAAFAKLRALAGSSAASWLGVAINRMALRPRHTELDERNVLWTSPVWALGTLVAQSMGATRWPTRFTEYSRFALADLAAGADGAGESACETTMGEDRMAQVLECGLIPLVGPQRKDTAFFPKESALDGGSLRHRLFFSRVIGVLLRIQEEFSELTSPAGTDPAELVRQVLAALFSETGHPVPVDLRVVAGTPGESGLPLDVTFTPPGSVLPSGEIGFQFLW